MAYAAPQGILHYIEAHGYQPPDKFLAAALYCPPMGSERYFEELHRVAVGLVGSAKLPCPMCGREHWRGSHQCLECGVMWHYPDRLSLEQQAAWRSYELRRLRTRVDVLTAARSRARTQQSKDRIEGLWQALRKEILGYPDYYRTVRESDWLDRLPADERGDWLTLWQTIGGDVCGR